MNRWYSVQEPEDAKLRGDRISDLLSSIQADARILNLARNPLLATLIALVHRTEAHLPGDRAELFERCVQTMLVDWPYYRGQSFPAIDEKLQRQYLDRLALFMQNRRTERIIGAEEPLEAIDQGLHGGGVVISRQEMKNCLSQFISERLIPEKESAQRLAEQWIDYLSDCTGLIVEQRPGFYGFLHLSMMEYLAACGLEREHRSPENLVEKVVEKYQTPEWEEVCLLVVGRHASEGEWVDALFDKMIRLSKENEENHDLASFLLKCMREEAVFNSEQQRQIIQFAANNIVSYLFYPKSEVHAFNEAVKHSKRNGTQLTNQWKDMLAQAVGDDLFGLVLLGGECDRQGTTQIDILSQRQDGDNFHPLLLRLWPGHPVGDWAAQHITTAAYLKWQEDYFSSDVVLIQALAALTQSASKNVQAFHSLALTKRALFLSSSAIRAPDALNMKEKNGQSLPPQIRFVPQGPFIWVSPRAFSKSPKTCDLPVNVDFGRLYNANFVIKYSRALGRTYNLNKARDRLNKEHEFFGHDYIHDFFIDIYSNCVNRFGLDINQVVSRLNVDHYSRFIHVDAPRDLAHAFDTNYINTLGGKFFGRFRIDFKGDFCRPFNGQINLEFNDNIKNPTMPPPDSVPNGAISSFWKDLAQPTDPIPPRRFLAEQFAEAWIALTTTINQPDDLRYLYFTHRIQSRWLLYGWPALDEQVKDFTDPFCLALYLALGWTQATITWQWPDSDTWHEIFKKTPPAHWLARAHYEICWLVFDPHHIEHKIELNKALQAGLGDEEYNKIAQDMLDLFFC